MRPSVAALHEHDVPAAAINSIAHTALHYPGAGDRQSSDVDILIPASTAATAANLLTRRQWRDERRQPCSCPRHQASRRVPGAEGDTQADGRRQHAVATHLTPDQPQRNGLYLSGYAAASSITSAPGTTTDAVSAAPTPAADSAEVDSRRRLGFVGAA